MNKHTRASLKEKFVSTLISAALGDALGAPFEGKRPNYKLSLSDVLKNRSLLRYTDDTIMMLIIAESIARLGKYDVMDVARGYVRWLESGDLRGIGVTTHRALTILKEEGNPMKSGVIDKWAAGNGVAMRIMPIALFTIQLPIDKVYEIVRKEAYITHRNELAISGAFYITLVIRNIIKSSEMDKVRAIKSAIKALENFGIDNPVSSGVSKALDIYSEGYPLEDAVNMLGNTGYVVHTVSLATYVFLSENNIVNSLVSAIRAGGDTDTNACVVGSISGAYYGLEKDILRLSEKLESRAKITRLANKIYSLVTGE